MRDRALAAGLAAAVSLYSRLWLELESLCDQLQGGCDERPGGCADRLEVVRLELIVLLDHCGSSRWQTLLDPSLLSALHQDLTALLSALAAPPDALGPERVIAAQNLLFDAVLDMHAGQIGARQRLEASAAAARLTTFAHHSQPRKLYAPADAVSS